MKKLESIIFYLFIFSIPVQSRLILHEWTRPFNQWASAYLYGTDMLLAAVFILWLLRSLLAARISNFKFLISKQFFKYQILNPNFFLILFLIISAVSILNSRIVELSLYQLLKLAEFIGFYFYLRSGVGKVFDFRNMLAVIIASGFFQSVIAIIQYAKQGSVGLRLLGESPLSVNAAGVAVFIADSVKYLRAYGTTPHPNILAAWLFVAIFAFIFYFLYSDTKSNLAGAQRAKEGAMLVVYVLLLFGLFFTFSRVVIGLWVLGVSIGVLLVLLKNDFKNIGSTLKSRMFALAAIGFVAVALFSFSFWPQVRSRIYISAQEEAVTQRVYYNKLAGSVAASHPFLGIGTGQFVPNMMSKLKHLPANAYQPVHNIYLLIASETGFLGLVIFLGFVVAILWGFARHTRFAKLYHFSFFILAGSFLVIGLFDHFLWTSQQGGIIFWMMLVLMGNSLESVGSRV